MGSAKTGAVLLESCGQVMYSFPSEFVRRTCMVVLTGYADAFELIQQGHFEGRFKQDYEGIQRG